MTEAEQLKLYSEALVRFRHDPVGFVMWAFPWRVAGTELENEDGPDEWQREELEAIGAHLRDQERTREYMPFRSATASGHGIGKSSQTAFVILWSMMTYANSRGRVTANRESQVRNVTWAEVGKWWRLHCEQFPIAKRAFEYTSTTLVVNSPHNEKRKGWNFEAVANNASNPAGFAGLHNANKRLTLVMDEASEIDDVIWDTMEGALTDKDTEIILLCYGNPTRNDGRFKEVVAGKFRHLWRGKQIDSRNVKRSNKALIEKWRESYGVASDFFKVRVLGQFPAVGSMQLIPQDRVEAARKREPLFIPSDPLVAGLDCARFGDDSSVLTFRRGRDAKTIPTKTWQGIDTMTLAADVALRCLELRVDALFVDVGGLGAGVYDRLVQLIGRKVTIYPVNFGGKGGVVGYGGIEARTVNMAATMWVSMREWLELGAIEDDDELEADLVGRQYGFDGNSAIVLEKKSDMKKRGLASPDRGDALALTFAMPVAPRNVASSADEIDRVNGSLAGGGDGFASIMERAMMDVR
ncbi:hypothetical protein [uncultured Hyphomicrobium sp.]|uniref:hypothetical protein n=1 Tax=uncultured Hyphomicrobium sp. TaxID=194373 RepID=UPI0025F80340|nr:hypothetical protein [uncultured Hyphomicrobium sp.]